MVLSGLRGVGKTVLLNALRGQAVQAGLGDRQVRGPPRPVAAAAARPGRARRGPRGRPPAPRPRPGRRRSPGVLKSFALRTPLPDRKGVPRGSRRSTCPRCKGRADSGDLELDLIELFTDVADLARDLGVGIALFVDEMQDITTDELAALCGACHEISQQGAPLIVVGAGLPHLPVALAASKSYAERLFRYVVVDRLPREMADRALLVPAGDRGRRLRPGRRSTSSTALTDGYPYFVQAYGKVTWDVAPSASPIRVADVREAAPEAEARAGRRVLRRPLRPGDPGRARLHARDGRPRARTDDDGAGDHRRHRAGAGPQAAEPLPGPRRADQEGPGLLQRARHGRVHRAALRQVPAQPAARMTQVQRDRTSSSPAAACCRAYVSGSRGPA